MNSNQEVRKRGGVACVTVSVSAKSSSFRYWFHFVSIPICAPFQAQKRRGRSYARGSCLNRLRTKRGTSFVISWATKPAKTSTGLRNDIDAASQANKKRPCRILQKKPPAKLAKKLK
ncbi:hypothetical protein PI124_g20339 [Phytophthora idaei]|nr:hypothetical protein PI125_g21850 [Phytophthora idaei]KAG3234607.1 hypothetical protein PI124_g20339 [Phytophthora idaei]